MKNKSRKDKKETLKLRIALGVSVIAWYLMVWAVGEREAYAMGKSIWSDDQKLK